MTTTQQNTAPTSALPPIPNPTTTPSLPFVLLGRLTALNALIERIYLAKTSMRLTVDRIFNDGISRKVAGKDVDDLRNLFMCPPDIANAFVKGGLPYMDTISELQGHLTRFYLKNQDVTFQKTELKVLWGKFVNIWSIFSAGSPITEITEDDLHAFVKAYNHYILTYLKSETVPAIRANADTIYEAGFKDRSAKMLRTLSTSERAVLYAMMTRKEITADMEPMVETLRTRLFVHGDNAAVFVPEGAGEKSYRAIFGGEGVKAKTLSLFDRDNPATMATEEVEACLAALPSAPPAPITQLPPYVLEMLDFWCDFMKSLWSKAVRENAEAPWNALNPVVRISAPLWDHPTRAISVRRIFEDMGLLRMESQVRGNHYIIRAYEPFFRLASSPEDLVRYVMSYTPASSSVYQEFLDVVGKKAPAPNRAAIISANAFRESLRHRGVTGVYEVDNLRAVAVIRGDLTVEPQGAGMYAYARARKEAPFELGDLNQDVAVNTPTPTQEETNMTETTTKSVWERSVEHMKSQTMADLALQTIREQAVVAILNLLYRQSNEAVSYAKIKENTLNLVGDEASLITTMENLIRLNRVQYTAGQTTSVTVGKGKVTYSADITDMSFRP